MCNGDSVMLLTESMGTALNNMELGIWVSPLCLPGIIQLNDAVFGTMDDQDWAAKGLDFLVRVHPNYIGHIAPPQLHRTAVDPLWDVLGIKFSEHHFARPGIVGDAKSRIE